MSRVKRTARRRCRECGKLPTFSSQRYEHRRLLSLGLSKNQAKEILPRCPDCVGKYLRNGSVVLPHLAMCRHDALRLVRIDPELWGHLLEEIQNQGALFACVRTSRAGADALLVATTAELPDVSSQVALEVAREVEKAIIARPEKAFPRFVASKEWGGEE